MLEICKAPSVGRKKEECFDLSIIW